MEDKRKRWLCLVVLIFLGISILMSIIIYVVDPFFEYRAMQRGHFVSARYSAPGVIKNYEYDTILIGSSMTQNFNMDLMREKLDCNPLHIGIGGMSADDQLEYIQLANKVGKADIYYICVDLVSFAKDEESTIVNYLMKDDILSKAQYVFSYESWFRILPVDLGLLIVNSIKGSIPDSYKYRTDIDYYGYWGNQFEFGEDIVLKDYSADINGVSAVEIDDLKNRMHNKIDEYFSRLDISDSNYVFFFPPYSVVYWANAQKQGYYEVYLDAKEYFAQRCLEMGSDVYDFQHAEITCDLNNYKDITHFSPAINDWMVEEFAKTQYLTDENKMKENRNIIDSNVENMYRVLSR